MDRYKVTSRHPEDLADGRVVGPGEVVDGLKADDPHNKRLLDEGKLVKLETKSKSPAKETTTSEGGND